MPLSGEPSCLTSRWFGFRIVTADTKARDRRHRLNVLFAVKDSGSAELSLVSLVALVKAPIATKPLLKDLLDER